MSLNGASHRFRDNAADSDTSAEHLNSLDFGGNVCANASGGLSVDVSPIRGLIDGDEIDYPGVTGQALPASVTRHLYIDDTGSLVVSPSVFPSYPGTKFFPLAVVVTNGAGITSITDKRWRFNV